MKIAHIKISSILGIDELELSPGGFTRIEGKNGTGKTSVLDAIKAVITPGHDATLLRNGAEQGEVVFVLDDGMSITKKVGLTASSTEVRDADGKKVPRPAEVIRALTDMLSVNPVAFMTAEKKDRVKVLLESMPLEVDAAVLTKLSGIKITAEPGVHALQVIEAVHKQVYEARTGTNRAVKEKDATIKQLRQAMPEAPGKGVEGSEDEIEAQVTTATEARDNMMGRIANQLDKLRAKSQTDIDAIRTQLQADIDALKVTAQEKVDTIKAELASSENRAAIAREKATLTHTEATAPLQAALTAMKADRTNATRRTQALETITTMETELRDLRAESESQTTALAAIEKYKVDLLAALPIAGLEVRDGEIFRDGVPFDRINTAQQVEVAVGIAKLRAGELGIVCVDRIESLDDESLDELYRQTTEAGLQCFVTRVGNEEFSISTQD